MSIETIFIGVIGVLVSGAFIGGSLMSRSAIKELSADLKNAIAIMIKNQEKIERIEREFVHNDTCLERLVRRESK